VSSGRHLFKQTDLARAFRAAEAAGLRVERCEIDPKTGKIIVVTSKEGKAAPADDGERNEWDEELNGPDQTEIHQRFRKPRPQK